VRRLRRHGALGLWAEGTYEWTAGSSQPRRRSALARTERFVIAGQVSFVLFAPVSFAVTLGLC